jgi:hypothetical protein
MFRLPAWFHRKGSFFAPHDFTLDSDEILCIININRGGFMGLKGLRLLSWIVALIATGILSFQPSLLAQTTGTISGLVTDPSGATVPDAKVMATFVQQNTSRTTQSNAEGYYIFNALPPGDYKLEVEKTGFQRLVQSDITLALNQNLRADLNLRVGELAQTVEVTTAATLVDTHSPALSGLVDDRRVVDLPLNGRNVISLAATLPGILSVVAPQQLDDARSGPIMNVNGSVTTQNLFTFNGGIFFNPSRNTGMNYPPPDALQEFSIQTQNFTAEYGRNAGSQVNVVSKSGTNELHGSLWEFLRNSDLNARDFFASRVSRKTQNQFGFAVGGPIKKDKLFIFGSYQGLRYRAEAVGVSLSVPSDAFRSGDFRSLSKTVENPVDALTGQPFTGPGGQPCIANNVVDPACITSMAKTLLPLIPQSSTGRVVSLDPAPRNGDLYLVRGDWNQSDKHRVSAHVFLDRNSMNRPAFNGGNIPGYQGSFLNEGTTMATLNDTYTFSPTLLTQTTATYLRSASLSSVTQTVTNDKIGVNMPFYPEIGRLQVTVGDLDFGGCCGSRVPFVSNNWQFRSQTNWIKGRHNFKFGGEWLHLTFLQIFLGPPNMDFNGSRSGDPMADFLVGAFRQVSGGFGVRTNDDRQDAPSLFFQDEFKVHPRLTLSYGVRWEPFFPWVDKYDRLTSLAKIGTNVRSTRFPDAPPGVLFAGDPGIPRTISGPNKINLAPRFGFAWDVSGNGKTSVRGSYGIFYDAIKADSVSQEGAPWGGNFSIYDGRAADPFGSLGLVPPPVLPAGSGFGCVDIPTFPGVRCDRFPVPISGLFIASNLKTPYVQSWNLTLQRQLTSDIMIQGAYLGKIGTHLDGWWAPNAARYITDPITGEPPSLQNVNDRVSIAPGIASANVYELATNFRSWYHSFQTQIIKRFSRGMSLSASYSLAKSIDIVHQNIGNWSLSNPFDARANKGRSDFDRRHAFVASWLWSPPRKWDRPFQKFLLQDWTFTGIHTVQSGVPFTIFMGDDVAQDGVSGDQQHAQLKPDAGSITREHANRADMIAKFFNTDAFVPTDEVPRGVYGNSGKNIISGPAFSNTDFSAIKDFRLRERLGLQFRSEFFNVFNQANFGCFDTTWGCYDPISTVNSPSFGQITSASPGREIQFALKLIW